MCTAAEFKSALAIAMAGLVFGHAYQARLPAASRLATEAMDLISSLGDRYRDMAVSLNFQGHIAWAQDLS